MRKERRDMEKSIAVDIKLRPKRFWKYVISKRKVRTGISDLKGLNGDGQQMAERDIDKAEVLAKFFCSVFTQESRGDLPEFENRHVSYTFEEIVCNSEVVKNYSGILTKINPKTQTGCTRKF